MNPHTSLFGTRVRRRWGALALSAAVLLVPGFEPVSAEAPNAGGGAFAGLATYADGTHGIPPVNTPCRPTSFTFAAKASITLANGNAAFGTWVLDSQVTSDLTGSAASGCENATIGGGTLTLDPIDVVNLTTSARLRCGSADNTIERLSGAFTRIGTDFTAVLGGQCLINSESAGKVAVYIRAQFVPVEGNGTTTYVRAAAFGGTLTVVPAGSVG